MNTTEKALIWTICLMIMFFVAVKTSTNSDSHNKCIERKAEINGRK